MDGHKDLMRVGNDDVRFQVLEGECWQGAKAFRLTRKIGGQERTLVMTYNPKLFHAQWLTLQNDLEKALEGLGALQQRLLDRSHGLIQGGRAPTRASVEKQCQELLKRQHLKSLIKISVEPDDGDIPQLTYEFDEQALHALANTYLGKTQAVHLIC